MTMKIKDASNLCGVGQNMADMVQDLRQTGDLEKHYGTN
jgi:hypothetical protein